jgi:hypothetical protein
MTKSKEDINIVIQPHGVQNKIKQTTKDLHAYMYSYSTVYSRTDSHPRG